jgi:hypothetical protein
MVTEVDGDYSIDAKSITINALNGISISGNDGVNINSSNGDIVTNPGPFKHSIINSPL